MSRSELSKELVLAFQYVDDRYLDLTEQEAAPETKKFGEKRLRPVAACIIGLIIILALPAVAIAANWFVRLSGKPGGTGTQRMAQIFG